MRFHRQVVILGWITDFYCPKYRLVVEVDGSTHNKEKDAKRDRAMLDHGIDTVRVTNDEVLYDIKSVQKKILVGAGLVRTK
jgi:very-short-patch-repair endonuclease